MFFWQRLDLHLFLGLAWSSQVVGEFSVLLLDTRHLDMRVMLSGVVLTWAGHLGRHVLELHQEIFLYIFANWGGKKMMGYGICLRAFGVKNVLFAIFFLLFFGPLPVLAWSRAFPTTTIKF